MEKAYKLSEKIVNEVNHHVENFKTEEFKNRLRDGETLDDILVVTYASTQLQGEVAIDHWLATYLYLETLVVE